MIEQAGSRYRKEVLERQTPNKIPQEWRDLPTFLGSQENLSFIFDSSVIGERFNTELKPYLDQELSERVGLLFMGVLALQEWRKQHGEIGLQVPDADLIQDWVLNNFHPDEFPKIAEVAFKGWGERLTDKPIPHIAQANAWSAEKVSTHLLQGEKNGLLHVDLGVGTGSTALAHREAYKAAGLNVKIIGVEITPTLVEMARRRTGEEVYEANALDWLREQPDVSVDVITMVYAIHHLHREQQRELMRLAYLKLKPNGVFVIADPTGRSRFNLEILDVKEPEAVIADFQPSVVALAEQLQDIGFSIPFSPNETEVVTSIGEVKVESTEQGNILDQGTLGYVVVAIKS